MADIAVLIFLLQQLGISLGLGAATFSLLFYVLSLKDGKVDESEKHFIHATGTVLVISLFLIVATGALITGAHYLAGEIGVISTPVFISKWLLVIIIMLGATLSALKAITPFTSATVSGASWYALFIIHTLAPNVSWDILGFGYVLWLAIFALGFWVAGRHDTPVPHAPPQKIAVTTSAPQSSVQTRPLVTLKSKYAPIEFDLDKGLAKASSNFSVAKGAPPAQMQ